MRFTKHLSIAAGVIAVSHFGSRDHAGLGA